MGRFALSTIYILTVLCLILAGCTEDVSDPLTHEAILGMLRELPEDPPENPEDEPPEKPKDEPPRDTPSRIAFVADNEIPQIFLINPDGTQLTSLTGGIGYAPFWSPDGDIAFLADIGLTIELIEGDIDFLADMGFTIQVIDVDGSSSEIVVDDQFGEIFDFDSHFSWSKNGRIAFTLMDIETDSSDIYSVNTTGGDLFRITVSPALSYSHYPSWSPDGTEIVFAFEDFDGNSNIFLGEVGGANVAQLTFTGEDYEPAWSPDGTKIAFMSDRDSDYEIYVMNTDGTNQINLTNNSADDERPSWSPDGTKIAFQSDRDFDYEIYVMNADGTNQVNITNNPSSEDIMPAWSP